MANLLIFRTLFVIISIERLCDCSELKNGIDDSVKGAIQLLSGINELLSAGKQVGNPLAIASFLSDSFINRTNSSSILLNLEKLYESFFARSNKSLNGANEDDIPVAITPIYEEDTTSYAQYVTEPINPYNYFTFGELPTVISMGVATSEGIYGKETLYPTTESTTNISDEILLPPENSTFQKFLSYQNNMCYKVKNSIESITHSDLVLLFMKFLEYEYLKAKESWERVKTTTNEVWEITMNGSSHENNQLTSTVHFLDQTKNQIRNCFNKLKRPFTLIMKGITNRIVKMAPVRDPQDDRSFCDKVNDAEVRMSKILTDLERNFNNKLDTEIKKEKQLLEIGKNNPDTLKLFSREVIEADINLVKDKLYTIYDYFKTAAINQLSKLQVSSK